jgi:hypothetical protein
VSIVLQLLGIFRPSFSGVRSLDDDLIAIAARRDLDYALKRKSSPKYFSGELDSAGFA